MAHFHTAEGFPSAQERPDECVFSFQGTRGHFCLTPLNSTKRGSNLNPLLKKIFEILFSAFLGNKKAPALLVLK